ncbi:50S ribosomal protein L32 [Patescibacteria group bacterium]
MPVPKQRHNKARQGRRRAGQIDVLKAKNSVKCSQCGKLIAPHMTCSYCGYYKGKEVISISKKQSK